MTTPTPTPTPTYTPILQVDSDLTDDEISYINGTTRKLQHPDLSCYGQPYDPDDEDAMSAHYELEAARGELAGAPHTLPCYECGGFNPNIPEQDQPHRTVVALGPILQPKFDPTSSYRLDCGHLAF